MAGRPTRPEVLRLVGKHLCPLRRSNLRGPRSEREKAANQGERRHVEHDERDGTLHGRRRSYLA